MIREVKHFHIKGGGLDKNVYDDINKSVKNIQKYFQLKKKYFKTYGNKRSRQSL